MLAHRQLREDALRHRAGIDPLAVPPLQAEAVLDPIGIAAPQQVHRHLDVAIAAGQHNRLGRRPEDPRLRPARHAHRIDLQPRQRSMPRQAARFVQQQATFAHRRGQHTAAQAHQALAQHLLRRQAIGTAQHADLAARGIQTDQAACRTRPHHPMGIDRERFGTYLRVAGCRIEALRPPQPAAVPPMAFQRILAAQPETAIGSLGDGCHRGVARLGRDEACAGGVPVAQPMPVGRPQPAAVVAEQLPRGHARGQPHALWRHHAAAHALRRPLLDLIGMGQPQAAIGAGLQAQCRLPAGQSQRPASQRPARRIVAQHLPAAGDPQTAARVLGHAHRGGTETGMRIVQVVAAGAGAQVQPLQAPVAADHP
ncbi:hypothetical protein D3C71_1054920 [compost metagenome]